MITDLGNPVGGSMPQDDAKPCECHLIEVLADMPNVPIEVCPLTKTFNLKTDESQFRLRFCFFCGGRLPQDDGSWRPTPDPHESAEAERLMSNVHSADEMATALGTPDEIVEWTEDAFTKHLSNYPQHFPIQRWRRCFRYRNRWPSLYLDIIEHEDGRLEHYIWGQSPADFHPDNTPKRKSWWRFFLPSPREH